jgi:pimeloyl-ACP methyl ester carboxylesterase
MSAVAQERYPFIPARLLLRADGTDYNSCSALAGLGGKTFITYAGQDVIIPAQHARNLAQCLGVPGAQLFPLPAATHMDWYEQLSPQQWDRMLGQTP